MFTLGSGLVPISCLRERSNMSDFKWYAVHVLPQKEKAVCATLTKRMAHANLSGLFKVVVAPEEIEVVVRNGKKVQVNKKIYPGYVFVNMILDVDTQNIVRSTPGVASFVSSASNKITPIKDADIKVILEAMNPEKNKPKLKWHKNDKIRVTKGPFIDLVGTVEDIFEDKQKMKVMIQIFGRDTPIELEYHQVTREN
jgi:transcriptional antiterminator NusG